MEELWALKAIEHAEVYFNLLCSVEPSRLKLSGSQELDDRIFQDFQAGLLVCHTFISSIICVVPRNHSRG